MRNRSHRRISELCLAQSGQCFHSSNDGLRAKFGGGSRADGAGG